MTPAIRAAVEVARDLGLRVDAPVVVQETNNTIVWLRPHSVLAKVGTHSDSAEGLIREHAIASALVAMAAPVAPPLPGLMPVQHPTTGFTVTLWRRLDRDPNFEVSGPIVGRSLGQLHGALASCDVVLPSFRVGLVRSRAALSDDLRVAALAVRDRAFLRRAFAALLANLDGRSVSEHVLHGEPHSGNYILTRSGLHWIDFESACSGPLEWDLAFLEDDALEPFGQVDLTLLELLRTLNSARVATWCWAQARFPAMRRHGEHHLQVVRTRWRERP